jgi:preprotein translocase subunit SecA
MFDGQILFGTNYDFEFSILRDEIYQMNLRYTTINGKKSIRKCEIVIVDEVDSLFLDLSLNSARMAIGSNVATSWVYDPIYSIV